MVGVGDAIGVVVGVGVVLVVGVGVPLGVDAQLENKGVSISSKPMQDANTIVFFLVNFKTSCRICIAYFHASIGPIVPIPVQLPNSMTVSSPPLLVTMIAGTSPSCHGVSGGAS